MIEGLFFALQLLAMWLLVRAVARGDSASRPEDLGWFAYREDRSEPPSAKPVERTKGGRGA